MSSETKHVLTEDWHDVTGHRLGEEYDLVDGKIHGTYKKWGECGGDIQCEYVHGVRQGKCIHDDEHSMYVDDVKQGPAVTYFNRAKREEYTYVDGLKHGKATLYHPNGAVKEEFMYHKDVRVDGPVVRYYPNKEKWDEYSTKNGQINGVHRSWHDNKEPWAVYEFKDGQVVKIISLTDEKGRDCMIKSGEIEVYKKIVAREDKDSDWFYGHSDTTSGVADSFEHLNDGKKKYTIVFTVPKEVERYNSVNINLVSCGWRHRKCTGVVDSAIVKEIVDDEGKQYQELPVQYHPAICFLGPYKFVFKVGQEVRNMIRKSSYSSDDPVEESRPDMCVCMYKD